MKKCIIALTVALALSFSCVAGLASNTASDVTDLEYPDFSFVEAMVPVDTTENIGGGEEADVSISADVALAIVPEDGTDAISEAPISAPDIAAVYRETAPVATDDNGTEAAPEDNADPDFVLAPPIAVDENGNLVTVDEAGNGVILEENAETDDLGPAIGMDAYGNIVTADGSGQETILAPAVSVDENGIVTVIDANGNAIVLDEAVEFDDDYVLAPAIFVDESGTVTMIDDRGNVITVDADGNMAALGAAIAAE